MDAKKSAKTQQLDLEAFAGQLGATVDTVNPDGSVNLIMQDGSKQQLDVNGYLKSKNIDPLTVDIKYNSPTSAKEENALGFMDQMEFIKAGTSKQQFALLQRKYGAENVAKDEIDGTLKVKDQSGLWKKADTSWYNEVIGGLPGTAASIGGTLAGAKMGAAAGTAIAPGLGTLAGAIIGGILGGATSATLAKYGENKAAEAMGIRTEEDLDQMKDELGREFANSVIWDTATLGAGKVLKSMGPVTKGAIADTLGALVKGTSGADWRVLMRSADDAVKIKALIKEDADVAAKVLSQGGASIETLLPSTKKISSILSSTIENAKKAAESQYEDGLKKLNAAGALEFSHLPITNLRNSLVQDLHKAGLVDLAEDGIGVTFKNYKSLQSSLTNVVDEKSQKRLRSLFEIVDKAYKVQEAGLEGTSALKVKPDLEELLKLKRYIGNVSKDLGHFMSPSSVSDEAQRILSRTAASADSMFKAGLSHVSIKEGDRMIPADQVFNNFNKKYSDFRQAYDVFSEKIPDFTDVNRVAKVAGQMTSEQGHLFTNAYKTMADSVGSKEMLNNLGEFQHLITAKNLANNTYGKGFAALPSIMTRTSAANVSQNIMAPSVKNAAAAKNIANAVGRYTGIARATQFLRGLSPEQRVNMMTDNALMSQFLQGITGYNYIKDQTEQSLMQQVPR